MARYTRQTTAQVTRSWYFCGRCLVTRLRTRLLQSGWVQKISERLTRVTVHVISSTETLSHIITASRRRGLDQNTGFALSSTASLLHPASSPQMIYNAYDSLYSQIKIRNTTREAVGFVCSRWRLITTHTTSPAMEAGV